ncbi:MAG TPA: PqqD family protein [Thermoanaerobaculia bacterium]|nr:PqqD family protein [Thermoanaerobaculia bacterium]
MRRNPAVEEAPLQNELMLFDPKTSKFYVLNGTMAFLWRNWDEAKTAGDLTALMTSAFDTPDRSSVAADIDAAIADLKQLGLLLD